jgi:translation initiation factor 1
MAGRFRNPGDDARSVYSSQSGPSGESGRKDRARAADPAPPRAPRGDGIVRVKREVAGRRGKPVTTVHGLPLASNALKALAGDLKRRCGSGGSAKGGVIEIQGDHRDTVVAELEARGYTVKRAGG